MSELRDLTSAVINQAVKHGFSVDETIDLFVDITHAVGYEMFTYESEDPAADMKVDVAGVMKFLYGYLTTSVEYEPNRASLLNEFARRAQEN